MVLPLSPTYQEGPLCGCSVVVRGVYESVGLLQKLLHTAHQTLEVRSRCGLQHPACKVIQN